MYDGDEFKRSRRALAVGVRSTAARTRLEAARHHVLAFVPVSR
jgi:hypothetical protein